MLTPCAYASKQDEQAQAHESECSADPLDVAFYEPNFFPKSISYEIWLKNQLPSHSDNGKKEPNVHTEEYYTPMLKYYLDQVYGIDKKDFPQFFPKYDGPTGYATAVLHAGFVGYDNVVDLQPNSRARLSYAWDSLYASELEGQKADAFYNLFERLGCSMFSRKVGGVWLASCLDIIKQIKAQSLHPKKALALEEDQKRDFEYYFGLIHFLKSQLSKGCDPMKVISKLSTVEFKENTRQSLRLNRQNVSRLCDAIAKSSDPSCFLLHFNVLPEPGKNIPLFSATESDISEKAAAKVSRCSKKKPVKEELVSNSKVSVLWCRDGEYTYFNPASPHYVTCTKEELNDMLMMHADQYGYAQKLMMVHSIGQTSVRRSATPALQALTSAYYDHYVEEYFSKVEPIAVLAPSFFSKLCSEKAIRDAFIACVHTLGYDIFNFQNVRTQELSLFGAKVTFAITMFSKNILSAHTGNTIYEKFRSIEFDVDPAILDEAQKWSVLETDGVQESDTQVATQIDKHFNRTHRFVKNVNSAISMQAVK